MKRVPDPTMLKGKSEVLEYGQPARATSVSRTVYAANGKLLHEDTLVLAVPLRAEGHPRGDEAEAEAEAEAERRRRSTRSSPAASTPCRTHRRRLRLSLSDRLDEPGGHARRQACGRVDDRMRGVAVGDELALSRSIAYS